MAISINTIVDIDITKNIFDKIQHLLMKQAVVTLNKIEIGKYFLNVILKHGNKTFLLKSVTRPRCLT